MGLSSQPLLFPVPHRESQAHAEGEGQRWIPDGADSLITGQVVELGVGGQPVQDLIAGAKIELGVTEIQISIGQEQRVPSCQIAAGQERRIVAAGGECCRESYRVLLAVIAHRGIAGMGRTVEGTGPAQRSEGPNRHTRKNRIERRLKRIGGKRPLHDRVQLGIAGAQK